MLFNRETDYAVRVLKNLSTDRPTSISSFVEGEFISEAIAYKVSRKLDKAGIIYGVRGSSGGYVLSRPRHMCASKGIITYSRKYKY